MAKSQAKKTAEKRAAAVAPVIQAAIQAAAQSTSEEPTSEFIVLHPISHDNEPYKRGEHIELTEEQADVLLALKVVAPYVAPTEASEETK